MFSQVSVNNGFWDALHIPSVATSHTHTHPGTYRHSKTQTDRQTDTIFFVINHGRSTSGTLFFDMCVFVCLSTSDKQTHRDTEVILINYTDTHRHTWYSYGTHTPHPNWSQHNNYFPITNYW